ncbi:Uncharacterised protein [Staphylococcus agnetis]|uniref:hypothetical protein n=1 Tax=Staphylococcus agnetis TaxID=985762 RepID=UPI000E01B8B5|nr:hypothetical protein [Staphylococcus agnetis]SUK05037.1 Uncharacterised protein [Staphylococcus agnetis]
MDLKIMIPLILIVIVYLTYCLYDLFKVPNVKFFSKWIWGIIVCISIPFGGIVYILIGRDDEEVNQ